MADQFRVVDERGNGVDVGTRVSRLVAAILASPDRCEELLRGPGEGGALTLVVREVPVCTDFQIEGSSHTGRQVEVDTSGGCSASEA